jgi:hypothetical protein
MITLSTLLSFLIPAIVVLLVLKLIALPFKIIISFIINMILGGIVLYGLAYFGIITVSLTWWMTAIVGVLGIPGAIIVAILSFFI